MTITLATLPEATDQEVFDQVVVHLITQGSQSVAVGSNTCMYRTKTGMKCAAGCLISEEEYSPDFEETSWDDLMYKRKVPKNHYQLIRQLQYAHDSWRLSTRKMVTNRPIPSRLESVAHKFVLDASIIRTTVEELE